MRVEVPDESDKLWGRTPAEQDLPGHLPVHWVKGFGQVQHTNVESLAFVPSPIVQKAQAKQGVNSAPAWSEATLLFKKVVCQPLWIRALNTLA